MFDVPVNPLYSMAPTMPPGWQGIPYMAGPIVAGMTGGVARPYVAPNMSTADATIAAQVNNPLYKTMMANMYGQLGAQIGTTMGDLRFVQNLGTMAGYSPAATQKALQGGMGAFARSQMGAFVMPFVDSGLNAMGLTGGSFVAATQAAYNGRMNLMSPGTYINPFDAGQQHQAMAAASATSAMLNNIISQRDANGQMTLLADQRITQGFSRERITQLAMRAAGMGMFTSNVDKGFGDVYGRGTGGLSERLSQAVGSPDFDLATLTMGNFDGKVGGGIDDGEVAKKVKVIRESVKRDIQGLTEAMSAMRDLTGEVGDELERLLNVATGGDWQRSGSNARAARDALRSIQAGAQVYNLDPKQMLNQIGVNRTMLQDDAGFDRSMLSLGFTGGGMFGLGAQAELMFSIEDQITARGVRGDPILSGRLRQQGLQAMRQNMNSQAGRAAQVLAYARQTGAVSEAEAGELAQMLSGGDSGDMASGINRLLTTVFGSAEVGRRFMNDSMQMNSMRMAMDDSAGKFAMTLMTTGANAEFRRREQVAAADQRLVFTQRALSESGMNTWQSAEGAGKVVANIVASIRGDGKDDTRVTDAAAFQQQYDAMIARGVDPRSAASAVVAAYKNNPVTSKYAQEIDLAVKQQSAANNEAALEAGGLESRQAVAVVRALSATGSISGADSAEVYKLVRAGKGAEALARVDNLVGGLGEATRRQMANVKEDAAKKHADALATMESNRVAEDLISVAAESGYGGEDVAKAYETLASAGLRYVSGEMDDDDYEDFWSKVSKSNFVKIFGDKEFEAAMAAADAGDAGYFRKMGRHAGAVRKAAIANLKDSGYGLQMSEYWGGGLSSVNSEALMRRRNEMINRIAENHKEDALLQAGDRQELGAKITDLMMGNKDWKSLLNVYGDKDLKSGIAKYGAAFEKYEAAQADFNARQEDFNSAMGALRRLDPDAYDFVKKRLASGEDIITEGEHGLGSMLGALRGSGAKDVAARVLAGVKARNEVIRTQGVADDALDEATKDEKTRKALKAFSTWKSVRDQRNAKVAGDAKVAAFTDEFDFSEEAMKGVTGASKAFLDKMFAAVSDEEVAAKLGLDPTKGMKKAYGETAMAIVKEKAMHGDEKAIAAMRAAKAAQRDSVGRIHGEIVIKNGSDSSPAVLEGNIGGL